MKNYPILIAVLALIIATLACGDSTPEVKTKAPDTAEEEQPTTAPTAAAQLGDTIEQDGYALSATQVADPATPGLLYQAEEGKRLVAIEIVVENTGADEFTSNPLYATLLDADGYSYTTELAAVDEQLDTVDLGEGEKVKGWVAFVIPDDAQPAAIKYEFAPFGAPTLRIDLTN